MVRPMQQARLESPVVNRPSHDSLCAAFEAAARDDAPFVTVHGAKGPARKTSREALAGAMRWATLLRSRGVSRGDCVPVLLPTGHAFMEALLGSMLAGAVPVPLATPMTFGSVERYVQNLGAIVGDCGARAIITYGRLRDAIAGDAAIGATVKDVLGENDLDGLGDFGGPLPSVGSRDPAFIQYTSGTTGRPKGAVVSHGAIAANAFSISHGLGFTSADVGVSWLPVFHDMGLIGVLLTSIFHPYPVHLISPESFVMRPRRWLDLVSEVGGTVSAAPNFAYDLATSRADPKGLNLATWRNALNGAEPVHASTVDRFTKKFAEVGFNPESMMPVYGLAEATLAVAFPSLEARYRTLPVDRAALEQEGRANVMDPAHGPGTRVAISVGGPVAGMSVEIVGEGGAVLPELTVGEILVRGPSLMDGYFRNEQASAAVLSGGALKTGDLGFLHAGRLYITGRAKELIIKGGRNLYPYDVERVAGEVDGVRAAAAFGVPNADAGTDDLVVVAETIHSDPERREKIAKEVRGTLLEVLGVKADDVQVCSVGAVPRTTSGKVRRGECARLFAPQREA